MHDYDFIVQRTTCGQFCVTLNGKKLKDADGLNVELTSIVSVSLPSGDTINYKDEAPKAFICSAKIGEKDYYRIKNYFED